MHHLLCVAGRHERSLNGGLLIVHREGLSTLTARSAMCGAWETYGSLGAAFVLRGELLEARFGEAVDCELTEELELERGTWWPAGFA